MIKKLMSIVTGSFTIALILSFLGCSMTTEKKTLVTTENIIKSPADTRNYRYTILGNGLKALIISDPNTDKSAAAVDVNVGSFQDPDDRLGLAHFLEHMLFMGTEKYPDVDSYSEFIRANGGSSNAYTASTRTNYYFDINSNQLQPALDRLAQFFVSPKLDPGYVAREKNAVDSEYRLHAREDGWRLFMALNATSNPNHPKSRFTIGSLDTLHDQDGQLWQKLKDFHRKYYTASNMNVVVYGKESLDKLEKWTNQSFSDVPSGAKPELSIGKSPYKKDQLQVRINIEPLKDMRILSLNFSLPSSQPFYQVKPLRYLARIIGYEGKGSLHSLLKQGGLIDSLAAYNSDLPREYSEFTIRMELTSEGINQIDKITATVFDYLDLIRKEGLQPSLYEENKRIARLAFRYQKEQSPQETVSALAESMHYLPAEHLLEEHYLYESYDHELIKGYLDRLTSENLRQIVIAKNLPTDKIEPYFDTKYSIKPLEKSLIERLKNPIVKPSLSMPDSNPFIASNLKLKQNGTNSEPSIILDQSGLRVWWLGDTSFKRPHGNIRLMISTPDASEVPDNNVLLQIYKALLTRTLNEYGYPAKEAGLGYSITAGRRGLLISLSGYQDKQALLLKEILRVIQNFKPDKKGFEQEKTVLLRRLKNNKFKAPYRLGIDALNQAAYPSYPSDKTLLAAAEKINFDQLINYAQAFYRQIHIEMLVYGNHSEQETLALASMASSQLLNHNNRNKRFDPKFYLLENSNRVLNMDIEHDDSMLVIYYQLPETNNRERARYALLGRLLATPFFNSLRTEQQLGYLVFSSPRPFEKHPGIIFVIQSPKLDPIGLEDRVDRFLVSQTSALNELTEQQLDTYRQGLISDLLKKDDNMDERNSRFWQGIASGELDFSNRIKIADEVRRLKPSDMHSALARLKQNKGKLVVRSFGKPHKKAYRKETERAECNTIDCLHAL